MEEELKRVVFGQDDAIVSLATSIKRSRAGLGQPEKPIGSFLFTGPTGVGKTEVARQLAAIQRRGVPVPPALTKGQASRIIGTAATWSTTHGG